MCASGVKWICLYPNFNTVKFGNENLHIQKDKQKRKRRKIDIIRKTSRANK